MTVRILFTLVIIGGLSATPTNAALVLSKTDDTSTNGATVDGTISAGEYGAGNSQNYPGGGTGFGGPLGNGTLYFENDFLAFPGNLYIGINIAGNLGGNIISIYLDTKAGGFTNDSTLNDFADQGRAVASKLTRDVQDNFPIAADYVLEFGNGFTNLFELKAGGNGSLNFIGTTNAGTGGQGGAGAREVVIPLNTLGMIAGQKVDFFAVLISDTNFASNEGIPGQSIANNPGFDNSSNGGGAVTWANYDQFITTPEPGTFVVWGLLLSMTGLVVGRRRELIL